MKVWINGTIVNPENAKISVLDHGVLYGDGVFEGIRCHNGRIADFQCHLKRLETSGRAIFLSVPSQERLEQIVFETVAALGEMSAYIRLVVTRGPGALGIDVASCKEPTVFCIAGPLKLYASRAEGVSLVTVSLRRPDADVLDPRVKSLNYLNNVMCKYEAKQRGADEALVLNRQGTIAEAAGANIFCVIDDVLCTPPTTDGALGGITRRRILKLAKAAGIATQERSLNRYDLLAADEVFLSGTGAGIVSVGSLDGNKVGRTQALADQMRVASDQYIAQQGTPVPQLQNISPDGDDTASRTVSKTVNI